jgi:4-hydroxybenzoate polyprenyltransferase
LLLFFTLITLAFALVLTLNWQTIVLSIVALFLAALYPFMKRYTHLPQVFLGAAFGWAIPMVYMASAGDIPFEAWLLFTANVCWVLAYDTMYAMVDYDDDIKIGVKSTAVLFGKYNALWIGIFQLIFLSLMFYLGRVYQLGLPYFIALGLTAALAIYQQKLIASWQRDLCFKAFLNNNMLGFIVFVGVLLSYI